MSKRELGCLLGLYFDNVNINDAIYFIEETCKTQGKFPKYMVTINFDYFVISRKDRAFKDTLLNADLCTPDGEYFILLDKFLGIPNRGKVAGSDLLLELIKRKLTHNFTVFIFGTKEESARAAQNHINTKSINLKVIGYCCPGFGSVQDLSSAEYISRINNANPDILFVSLNAQKAMEWIALNRSKLNTRFICQVGAGIDYLAGKPPRAPLWMQHFLLEWVWRLIQDPKLLKRYAFDVTALVYYFLFYLLPYRLFLIRKRQSFITNKPLSFEIIEEFDIIRIGVNGAMNIFNYSKTHELLEKILNLNKNIEFDLANLEIIDNPSLTLLLFFTQQLKNMKRCVTYKAISRNVRKIFRYNLFTPYDT